ncbi:MAG TPA: formate/nitrite transporter family protein [Mycobacteriales bacterium]|nr:formate/nitrite transporter family protein [Mycobacteriales bacterium]
MAVDTRTRADDAEDEDDVVASNEQEVEDTLQRTVEEGKRRLERSWAPLIATGLVGGIDVGTGVMALLVVEAETGNKLLAGLAFSIGFIALAMARSELFTEDFLVPVGTVIARQAPLRQLARLWVVTAAGNLVGGWAFTGLIISSFPAVRKTAVDAGAYYTGLGIGWRSFALALLGGAVITLMTWMQHATESLGTKLVPAVTTGFLLAGMQLNHAIVASLIIFAGLHTHMTSYGYLDWAGAAGWAALGNMVGGIALVTLLRLLQVPHKVKEHAKNPSPDVAA